MHAHDFSHIRRLHAPIPHPLGIDDHHRTFIAQSHAATGCELHIVIQAARLRLAIKSVQHCERTTRGTRDDSLWLLLRANEKMKTKWLHRNLRPDIV